MKFLMLFRSSGSGKLDKDFVHALGSVVLVHRFRPVERGCTAVYHDAEAVAVLGLIHVVGGDKDGESAPGGFVNHVPEAAPGYRIDTAGWFVSCPPRAHFQRWHQARRGYHR